MSASSLVRVLGISFILMSSVCAMADDKKPADAGATPAGEDKVKIADRDYVKLATTMGDIYIELDRFHAPISTQNFLDYVESEHYNGTIFHRVISGFMIQGGGFEKDMKQKTTRAGIKNEWRNGLTNKRGTIAMARLGNQPDSATSQFFINVVDNDALNMPRDGAAYAVFGKVIKGMDVVDRIKAVPVHDRVIASSTQRPSPRRGGGGGRRRGGGASREHGRWSISRQMSRSMADLPGRRRYDPLARRAPSCDDE